MTPCLLAVAGACSKVRRHKCTDRSANSRRCRGIHKVYCAHEYTLSNIAFARAVEPDNDALLQREFAEREKRDRGIPTVPSTIALERATNPFMRSEFPSVIAAANKRTQAPHPTPSDVLATIREWKNSF